MGRGIDSRNRVWNGVAKLHRLAGRYPNPMPSWFQAPPIGAKVTDTEVVTAALFAPPSTSLMGQFREMEFYLIDFLGGWPTNCQDRRIFNSFSAVENAPRMLKRILLLRRMTFSLEVGKIFALNSVFLILRNEGSCQFFQKSVT
jgi:hypothetical protein